MIDDLQTYLETARTLTIVWFPPIMLLVLSLTVIFEPEFRPWRANYLIGSGISTLLTIAIAEHIYNPWLVFIGPVVALLVANSVLPQRENRWFQILIVLSLLFLAMPLSMAGNQYGTSWEANLYIHIVLGIHTIVALSVLYSGLRGKNIL